jgi:hypothetical protein
MEPTAALAAPVYLNRPGVAVVTWNPTFRAVSIDWQGWADSNELAELHEAALRALSEHHGSRWLSDSRNMKVIKQADQDWINQNFFPRAMAAGLRRVAIVIAKSALAMMNVDQMAARVPDDNKLQIAYFGSVDEAGSWLARPART